MAEGSVIDAIIESLGKFMKSKESKIGIGGFAGIVVVMCLLFYYQVHSVEVAAASSGGGGGGIGKNIMNITKSIVKDEMVEETKSYDCEYEFNGTYQYATQVVFTLTWIDEPDMTPPGAGVLRKCTNQPDTFVLEVTSPSGKNLSSGPVSNTHGSPGNITLKFNFSEEELSSKPALGNWSITIKCTDAGDQTFPYAPLSYVDSGNKVSLDVAITYYSNE